MSTAEKLFSQVKDRPGAVWLDVGLRGTSIVSWDPVEVCTEMDWPEAGRRLGRKTERSEGFSSGVIGYIGYGAGHAVEAVPACDAAWEPDVWLSRYEGAVVFRDGCRLSGPRAFRAEAEKLLGSAALEEPAEAPRRVARSIPAAEFEDGVRRVLAWILDGDCYQVNLSRPVFVDDVADPFACYRRLRRINDASMGAYLVVDEQTRVLSNSPEVLLTARGRALFSDPIKGTRPRGDSPAEDAALREELRLSEKDQAELAMIVDLVRNDLGRVAIPGSVKAAVRILTAHGNVHHASWPVRARTREGLDSWDALAAAFPPGSVTGAPKIRACKRIHQLETSPRGVYCGSIGYSADGGDADWSVAIRTAVWQGGRIRYHVGGGIVADSDPHEEWLETEDKGRALARAFGVI